MPIFKIHNLSLQLSDGDALFHNLSWNLTASRAALVGRNGIGKSLLIKVIRGEIPPTQGDVVCHTNIGYFTQHHEEKSPTSTVTIAEFLGLSASLHALDAISMGSCDPKDFATVGDNWLLAEQLKTQLNALNISTDYWQHCRSLSGGQLARLKLWQLFNANHQALILDEPSNHLDLQGKRWLIEQLLSFNGAILIVSHDPLLLQEMTEIYELTPHGLTAFSGNYHDFLEHKGHLEQALNQQINHIKREQRKLQLATQTNHEKAQQRAAQGNALRKQGSQAKVLLDAKKDHASANTKRQKITAMQQHAKLTHKANLLLAKQTNTVLTHFALKSHVTRKRKTLIRALQLQLPYGTQSTVDLVVREGEKWHISANNGAGKSTLLNVLQQKIPATSGTLQLNSTTFCLDQNYQLLKLNHSVLDNLTSLCPTLSISEARTLLAGIGFKKDHVYSITMHISGGQKMKLAMLIVSHQPNQPILLLDEPDNHLDADAKHQLASALRHYQGAILLVSHDPAFIAHVNIDHTLNL
ncbi:ATP-binding cassette domain-containing protein [Pseudoalteromonas sp. MMG012]|uniref:ATP-binding cassette domain-containing protein n=1 Tax=Pseudoalteromonas sp. MMG012 TaxID=2822686 RepID=UPI001B39F727|nr:ATP-binding cassette domain-containing protein [Pseudoalteromonas sp. MMG012]MBQ4852800.1 ABC-F family ATP-binding cassette domain-containing protein [Pseudoalteromonas sp. MMG012]